jgi:hypothetical protein
VEWLLDRYEAWGVPARREEYGTWRGWTQGILHVDLLSPRVRTLEAHVLAWSPGTDGPVEGDVVALPEFAAPEDVDGWLQSVRGKVILTTAPQLSCREPQAFEALATEATVDSLAARQRALNMSWNRRRQALGEDGTARLEQAGAIAIVSSRWSGGWGVNKIFSAGTESVVAIDVSCEDYGLLARLAENEQGPRIRIESDAELTGEQPMFNVVAEIRGTELPNEYVLLGAHLDSWHASSGATDNGTGTIMMLEAMRILSEAYPAPRRTILVGHWGAEELGLVGSRAFSEDHPDVVENLQAAFNQDNGTWRIDYLQAQGFLGAGAYLASWLAQVPEEIAQHIELDVPGPQEFGGSDHMSFICHGAPSFRFQSHYPDYRQYTWHTNRDTYDKVVFDDLRNNATLAAMMAYLASEDPDRVPRTRSVLPANPDGSVREWAECRPAPRASG